MKEQVVKFLKYIFIFNKFYILYIKKVKFKRDNKIYALKEVDLNINEHNMDPMNEINILTYIKINYL